ncbi:MAG: hypothetical protein ACRETY_15550 [Steroidobacteraceae bacterium]
MLPDRLTGIDESNRGRHYLLEEGDRCYYFSEYQGRGGYAASETNQLIFNYKCKPTRAALSPGRRWHKENAITQVVAGLRRVMSQANAEAYTWVPVPTLKIEGHADYDDRLIRTLTRAFTGYDADVRVLLRQTESTEPDHDADDRLTADALYALLEVDNEALAAAPLRRAIVLFDDVLTSGKHFKCAVRRLRTVFPADVPIVGVFIARCVFPDPADDFEVLQ